MPTIAIEPTGRGEIRIDISEAGRGQTVDDALEEIYGDVKIRESVGEKVIRISRPLFTEALDLVQVCAEAMTDRLTQMDTVTPDEVEMQLAIKVDAKVGAKLVELAGGAQVQVVLRWRRPHA